MSGLDPARVLSRLPGLRGGAAQFFANDAPEDFLKRFLPAPDVLCKSRVDEALVVAATSGMNLGLEPLENAVVEANGDAGLAGRERVDSAPLGLAEIVLTLHGLSLIHI